MQKFALNPPLYPGWKQFSLFKFRCRQITKSSCRRPALNLFSFFQSQLLSSLQSFNSKIPDLCFVILQLEKSVFSWTKFFQISLKNHLKDSHFWTEKCSMLETDSKAKAQLKFSFWLKAVYSLPNQIASSILTSVVIGWNSVVNQSTDARWRQFSSFWKRRDSENKDECAGKIIDFYYKTNKEASTVLCSVVKCLGNG